MRQLVDAGVPVIVGTVLVQFAIVLVMFILANRWIVKKTIGQLTDTA